MNKSNWSRTRSHLRIEMKRLMAEQFQPTVVSGLTGAEAYSTAKDTPRFFLAFYRSNSLNVFFADFGWSSGGVWPIYPSLAAEITSFQSLTDARFRVEQFWTHGASMQAWCLLKPTGLRQIDPVKDSRVDEDVSEIDIALVARECCEKIRECILPAMEQVKKGLK